MPAFDEDEDGSLQPDVIEALISMDPYLSDFERGTLVRRDGQPMTEVEHVRILDATRRDLDAAREYLDFKRQADAERYDHIQRLHDLTAPYDGDGTIPLGEALLLMPAEERAAAENIVRRIRGAMPPAPLTDDERNAEFTRLQIAAAKARMLFKGHGEHRYDARTQIQAGATLLEIYRAAEQLVSDTPGPREIAITAEEAEAKLSALTKNGIVLGPGTDPDGDR